MVLDILENAKRYAGLGDGFCEAIEFLQREDLRHLPAGRYEIAGERVFAMISEDMGRRKEDASLETHARYIDIQLVLAGVDTMGWKPASHCKEPSGEYDREKDIRFFDDEPDSWISVEGGAFAIFFPEDAHMPLVSSGMLRKVVVKVALSPGNL